MTQSKGYGQFCPVARAAEIFAERWTPLLVREIMSGTTRFNDLQRGVPRMSSSLLSRRLKEMEHAGIIERRKPATGRGWEYHPTQAGLELMPIVEGLGNWAQRWVRDDLVADQNLDPDLLMWDVRRRVENPEELGQRRFVVRFEFAGVPSNRRRYWLVFDQGGKDLCIKDPGFDVDLYVSAPLRSLTKVWLGHLPLNAAVREKELQLDGARGDIAGFKKWFCLGHFAPQGLAETTRA